MHHATDTASTRTEAIGALTSAIEFLSCAVRAIGRGHSPASQDALTPLLWAEAKLVEVLASVGGEAHEAAIRNAWGRDPSSVLRLT